MSTHDGWIDGFPFLRIDNFSNQQHPESGRFPLHYLLTHAHSDHLTGLDAKGFSGKLYMTDVTKQLVLEWMEAQERVRYAELGQRINPAYKFENLKRGRGRGRSPANQIVKVSYNQPFQLPGSDGNPAVTVTAIDANHCPGSCMYLLESICGARSVLVTGDIRIDADYLEVLRRNPALGPYTAYAPPASRAGSSNLAAASAAPPSGKELGGSADERPTKRKRVAVKTLDRIYLDTSQVLLDEELVTKENAVADFLSLLDLYPPDTLFYLNAWTWGYEELLKGVYKAYGEKIHLDWHKGCQYSSPAMRASDPLLAELGAPDPHPAVVDSAVSAGWKRFRGRFHACERRWKCDQVWQDGVGCYCWEEEYVPELKGVKTLRRPGSGERLPGDEGAVVVNVNPAEMPAWMWREYFEEKKAQLETCSGVQAEHADGGKDPSRGRWPTSLVIPLARHSALPELRSLVSLLQPRSVFPLTCTHPSTYQSLPSIFDGHLAPGGTERLQREALQYVAAWAEKRAAAAAYAQLAALVGGAPADGAEAAEGLIEPDALSELSKKGINVEGGEAVVEEVLALMEKARKGRAKRYGQVERRAATTSTSRSSPSVSTQPPGAPKRSSAAVEVITLTDSEESQSLHEFPPSKRHLQAKVPSRTAEPPGGARGATAEPRVQVAFASATGTSRAGDRRPSPFLDAAGPSPPRLLSPIHLGTSRSTPSSTSSEIVIRRSRVAPAASSELGIPSRILSDPAGRSVSSRHLCPTSDERDTRSPPSRFVSAASAPELAPVPFAPVLSASSRATRSSQPRASSDSASGRLGREERRRLAQAFYRRVGGKLGLDGSIVPFEPDDPRLQGRSALAADRRAPADQKENSAVLVSPQSFRTVSASP